MILYLTIFMVLIYVGLKYVYAYWPHKGFPYVKPSLLFGNLTPVIRGKRSFGFAITDLYYKTQEPFIGIYLFFRPALLVRDVEMVHKVMAGESNSFHDHGIYNNEKVDPMARNLFTADGADWRGMRQQFSPTFTSGKLKAMFETISDVAVRLDKYLESIAGKKAEIEFKDLASRYATDIIATVFFGYEIDTINNVNHEFREIGRIQFAPKGLDAMRINLVFLWPKLLEFFRIKFFPKKVRNYMIKLVEDSVEYREKNNYVRKDFMQLLLQLRNANRVNEDGDWNLKKSEDKKLSIEEMAGQITTFYMAGMETSASTIAHCIHELSYQPELQKRLQNEIDEVLARHNNQMTYDALKEMKFLDLCFNETQRMYPALPVINRQCTIDFKIPGTKLTVKKGTPIIVPVYGVHNDPNNFENPKEFIPDRFAKPYNQKAFMPFGGGPHICIGSRLGLLTSRMGIVTALRNYNFKPAGPREIDTNPNSFTMMPKNGIPMIVTKRQ